ncbi:MAG: Secretory protein, partial [Adhaeribacter sp.]|nr:Secretory protein [Adhaeribacter sp.]
MLPGSAQIRNWQEIGPAISIDSVSKGKYKLVFINRDSAFAAAGDPVKQ